MIRKWSFDEAFLKEQIRRGKIRLKHIDTNSREADEIISMIDNFEQLLGIEKDEEIPKISLDRMVANLNNIMNDDLQLIKIDEWRELKHFCQHMPKYHRKDTNSSELPRGDGSALRASLSFYKNLDINIYGACKRIVESDYKLVNFVPKKIFKKDDDGSSYVFECDHLDLPFVNITCHDDLKYPITVHELRHAATYYLYGKRMRTLLGELPSIYSELLFTDKINRHYDCGNLYNFRINDVGNIMAGMGKYINFLERFDSWGREFNIYNIYDILEVSNNKQLLELYKKILKDPFLRGYDYLVSTLIALEFRECYYAGYKNKVNEAMENIMLGAKVKPNYDKLAERYINHTNYTYSLSHK